MSDINRSLGLLAITIAIICVGIRIDGAIRDQTRALLCIELAKEGVDCEATPPRTDGEDGQ